MACRISDYVLAGELRNTRRNGVFGWIEFAPDYGICVELTGNMSGQLQGKHIKFRVQKAESDEQLEAGEFPDEVDKLADRQIGVVGEMVLRRVRVPSIPIDDFLLLEEPAQEKHLVEKDSLYLEWFSQNGRVIAELVDLSIEFVDDQQTGDGESAASGSGEREEGAGGFTEIYVEDEAADAESYDTGDGDDEDEDPFGLFGQDVRQAVADSLGPLPDETFDENEPSDEDFSEEDSEGESAAEAEPRSWDDVIPGIDAETKEMYEQWDEIFEGKKDEPLSYLFHTPLRLPLVENVTSDEEAERFVRAILAQLALLSVALDVCEHYGPLETYRLLMKEILPTAKVHPNLAASEMVQHYSTSDYCSQCDEELDAEYDEQQDDDEEPEDEPGDMDDLD